MKRRPMSLEEIDAHIDKLAQEQSDLNDRYLEMIKDSKMKEFAIVQLKLQSVVSEINHWKKMQTIYPSSW